MGVLAPFFASSFAIWPATVPALSGLTGMKRSVWHEFTSRPNTRIANGVPAGMICDVIRVSVSRAISMRRLPPIFCSMLPDASKMISTALSELAAAGGVTTTKPGSSLPCVIWIDVRASVAYDCPSEYRSSYSPGLSGACICAGLPVEVYAQPPLSPSRAPFGTMLMKSRWLFGPAQFTGNVLPATAVAGPFTVALAAVTAIFALASVA